MSTYDVSSLIVQPNDTFSQWRGKFNQLVQTQTSTTSLGDITALATGITSRSSLVDALNYVYSIRVSEGTPLEGSSFTNCSVPETSRLDFGESFIGYSNSLLSFGDKLYLNPATGFLGIMTTTPESALHVVGTTQSEQFKMHNTTNDKTVDILNQVVSTVNYNIINSNAPLMINSSNSDLILNYGGGKVGIGQVNQNQLAEMLNLRTTGTGLGFRMDTPSMSFKFRLDPIGYTIFDSDVNRFRVHQNGNIGIGVDVPNYQLHVSTTMFASEITVGNSLYVGSNKIINLDGNGKVQVTTPSGSSLVQGTTTIIGTDDKIPVSVIKGLTSDATSEGTSNLYFTNARAISAIATATITPAVVTVSSLLNLPSYTTALRPTAGIVAGTVILDSTLSLPIFYTGTVWKDFTGATV